MGDQELDEMLQKTHALADLLVAVGEGLMALATQINSLKTNPEPREPA